MAQYSDQPAVGDVVNRKPGTRGYKDVPYVVAEVHDYRHDANPTFDVTIVEEDVYRHYVDRERCAVPDWSPWHAVVGVEDVERASSGSS